MILSSWCSNADTAKNILRYFKGWKIELFHCVLRHTYKPTHTWTFPLKSQSWILHATVKNLCLVQIHNAIYFKNIRECIFKCWMKLQNWKFLWDPGELESTMYLFYTLLMQFLIHWQKETKVKLKCLDTRLQIIPHSS